MTPNPIPRTAKIFGEYYRSKSGTIHLSPCAHMGGAQRWGYADRMTLRQVVADVAQYPWLRLCRHCWPAGALEEAS